MREFAILNFVAGKAPPGIRAGMYIHVYIIHETGWEWRDNGSQTILRCNAVRRGGRCVWVRL